MLYLLLLSCSLAFLLFIWIKLDTITWYLKLFNLCNNIEEIQQYPSFVLYLHGRYNNFFTALLSCPFCLAFWLNIGLLWLFIYWYGIIGCLYCGGSCYLTSLFYLILSASYDLYSIKN